MSLYVPTDLTSEYLKKILQQLKWETDVRATGERTWEFFCPWNIMYIKVVPT